MATSGGEGAQVASCKCIFLYGRNSHLQKSPHLELAESNGSEMEVLSHGHVMDMENGDGDGLAKKGALAQTAKI